MKKKLKVVQIGAGHDHASSAMSTLLALPELFEVVGVAQPEEDAQKLDKHYDGVRLLSVEQAKNCGADAAVIETTDKYLTKYALEFARCGMAIQMDKPGGADQEEFVNLFDLCEKKNVPIQTGYMYRFNPAVRRLFALADSGEMGKILYVNAEMSCLHPASKREWLNDYPGGMLYFLGCHLIDVIYRLQGEPEDVLPLSGRTGIDGVNSEDVGFAVFRYKSGCSFARSTAVEHGGFMRRQIVAVGENGTFEIRPTEYNFKDYSKNLLRSDSIFTSDGKNWAAVGEKTVSEPFDRYERMFRSFHAIASGEKENPYTHEYEKRLHALILRACGTGNDEK